MAARHQRTASTTTDESVPSTSSGGVPIGKEPTAQGLMFTPRGTVAGWYTEDYTFDAADPGPSSSTYGPDLWKSRREAWLTGTLLLNPPAPKTRPDTSSTHSSEQDPLDPGATSTTTTTTAHDDPTRPPVLSTIQSLSAKARGKLPSFLHLAYPPPLGPKAPSPPSSGGMLSSLDKLEMLMAEPGAEENDKVWRQGGLEAVWRMLTDSKTLKQPMRLGLVIQILKAGWIRDGTWPSSLAKDGRSRRAMEAVVDDPFFDSPPPSPVQESGQSEMEREVYRPPKKL